VRGGSGAFVEIHQTERQFWVKYFEVRFVEVLHRLRFIELGEELYSVHAIESVARPVHYLGILPLFQLDWIGQFAEKLSENWNVQIL
jgi:hypothetical protein